MTFLSANLRWPIYMEGISHALQFRQDLHVLELGRTGAPLSFKSFYEAGMSTLFFALQAGVTRIDSVDINPDTEKPCQKLLGPYAYKVVFHNKPSHDFLREYCFTRWDVVLYDSSCNRKNALSEFILSLAGWGVKESTVHSSTVVLLDDVVPKTKYILEVARRVGEVIAVNEIAAALKFPDLGAAEQLAQEILTGLK
jgi:hypothetical protein